MSSPGAARDAPAGAALGTRAGGGYIVTVAGGKGEALILPRRPGSGVAAGRRPWRRGRSDEKRRCDLSIQHPRSELKISGIWKLLVTEVPLRGGGLFSTF